MLLKCTFTEEIKIIFQIMKKNSSDFLVHGAIAYCFSCYQLSECRYFHNCIFNTDKWKITDIENYNFNLFHLNLGAVSHLFPCLYFYYFI